MTNNKKCQKYNNNFHKKVILLLDSQTYMSLAKLDDNYKSYLHKRNYNTTYKTELC